jgi:hypothetical protein
MKREECLNKAIELCKQGEYSITDILLVCIMGMSHNTGKAMRTTHRRCMKIEQRKDADFDTLMKFANDVYFANS